MADTTYNPQQPSNLGTNGANNTTKFFNNFFAPDFTVSQNTNDAILGYFEEQTGSIESAKLLAQAVINTAQSQREDPMTVLMQFQNLPADELNTLMTLYLNISRVNTSLLGIKNVPKTSPLVARTILV